MFKRMKLKTKLVVTGILLTAVPLVIFSLFILSQNAKMKDVAGQESINLAYADLDHMAQNVYSMCEIHHEISRQTDDAAQASKDTLRNAIMSINVGKTGYVFVLDSEGKYLVSNGGERDGENIWNAKDSNGTLFIQELCKKAVNLSSDDIAEQRYFWKNEGDTQAREKIARVKYFKPWGWVIGVGSYTDEFYAARDQIAAIGNKGNVILGSLLAVAFTLATVVWFVVAGGITKKINAIVLNLSEGSAQVASASTQISSASQSLAEGATEQAAGLQETSSSLEEMSAMTKQNADNAQQANTLATQSQQSAQNGSEAMQRMSQAIDDIQKSSDETAKIIKVIDEIAFQTNLLALNAAVEAARAGEAGKGFAVVAEEVRNLAMRSADAAKNTADMIEESVKNSRNGVEISSEVSKVLGEIVDGIKKTTDLVGEISAASAEQAQGIDQVNTAVSQMDKVTQQNAANAEESASAASELNAQSQKLQSIVQDLVGLVQGTHDATVSYSTPQRGQATRRPNLGDQAFHQIAESKPQKAKFKANASAAAANEIPFDDEDFSDF